MKYYVVFITLLLFGACGGSSAELVEVPQTCEAVSDCNCPGDYESSCEDGQCLCLKTEIVKVDGGTNTVYLDSGSPACQADTDCNCPVGYEPSCHSDEGICYCAEINLECYPIARGEFIQLVMEKLVYLDSYQVSPDTARFSDVPESHPYFTAIMAAVERGLIDNVSTGLFRPEDGLNRAEASKIFFEAFELGFRLDPPSSAPDLDEMAWYYAYVLSLLNNGIADYYVDGTFGPADLASSCFVNLVLERMEDYLPLTKVQVHISSTPAPNDVTAGQADVILHGYTISPGYMVDVTATAVQINIEVNNPAGVDPVMPTNFSEYVTNVTLKDDQGTSIGGPWVPLNDVVILDSGTHTLRVGTLVQEDFSVTGDTSVSLRVWADMGSQLPSGYQVRASVGYPGSPNVDSYFRDQATGELIPSRDVLGAGESPLYGHWMTVN